MMKLSRLNLNQKILILISSIIIVSYVILTMQIINEYRTIILKEIKDACLHKSQLIEVAVTQPMRKGDDYITKQIFQTLFEQNKQTSVYLTNYHGNITYSTNKKYLRVDMQSIYHQNNIVNLLNKCLKSDDSLSLITDFNNKNFFIKVSNVKNESSCYHCHGRKHKILGQLVIVQDVSNIMDNFRYKTYKIVLLFIISAVILIGILWFFIRRQVINPLIVLINHAKRFRRAI